MPDLYHKAVFFLNMTSFLLYTEKYKRLQLFTMLTSMLEQLDPNNHAHLESLCFILVGTLERSRSLKFTMYVHHPDTEARLQVTVNKFLAHYAREIDHIATARRPTSKKSDPLRHQLILICLLAKIKFEIKTPIFGNLGQLLPDMNDFAFSICFSAVDDRFQLETLVDELKARLKPGSGFAVNYINVILGSLKFRSKLCLYKQHPTEYQSATYESDITIEQLLQLPTAQSPLLFQFTETLKKFMPVISTVIEKYISSLFRKSNLHLVGSHYCDMILARDLLSPNEYRNPKSPFSMHRPEKFYFSQEEALAFFKLCDYLNYNSVAHWRLFEQVLLTLLGDIGIKLGHLKAFVQIASHQRVSNFAVWSSLEKVDGHI